VVQCVEIGWADVGFWCQLKAFVVKEQDSKKIFPPGKFGFLMEF
jgi:hypothetical protein